MGGRLVYHIAIENKQKSHLEVECCCNILEQVALALGSGRFQKDRECSVNDRWKSNEEILIGSLRTDSLFDTVVKLLATWSLVATAEREYLINLWNWLRRFPCRMLKVQLTSFTAMIKSGKRAELNN